MERNEAQKLKKRPVSFGNAEQIVLRLVTLPNACLLRFLAPWPNKDIQNNFVQWIIYS